MSIWHTSTAKEVLSQLNISSIGIPILKRETIWTQQTGRNEGKESVDHAAGAVYRDDVLILMAAAVLSFFLGETTEAIAILAIVLLFGILGFVQEYRAEKAMAALQQMVVPTVRVRRKGHVKEISASKLVQETLWSLKLEM